jgi:hypothetical protein
VSQEAMGALSARLLAQAEKLRTEQPDSIYAYALWRALLEFDHAFEDEQGISSPDYQVVSDTVGASLDELAESEATSGQTESGESALRQFLFSLAKLRSF